MSKTFCPDLGVAGVLPRVAPRLDPARPGLFNPDVGLFVAEAMDFRSELVVRHGLPYSDVTHLSADERERAFGPNAAVEFSHSERADRRTTRGRLHPHRVRPGSAPIQPDRPLHARILRHPRDQADPAAHAPT